VSRYRVAGEAGLVDRSSAPRRVANRTPQERVAVIVKLRQLRMTAAEIAETLRMPPSTVSSVLTRCGVGRLGRLGLEPAQRYERARPGELVHIDVKKLGRIKGGAGKRWRTIPKQHYTGSHIDAAGRRHQGAGWDYVHVAVDDYSRLAYAEVLLDERASTAAGFLRRATAWYQQTASASNASSPTTAPATGASSTPLPAASSASATSAPAPTGHKQTAKPSASSAP
jgi:hypothetical protein